MTAPPFVPITLTPSEFRLAAQVGIQRQATNVMNGLQHKHGLSKGSSNGWSIHVEGAAGELAVARYMDMFWSGSFGEFGAGDVGEIEVRTTPRLDGSLILHITSPDLRPFVLVTGSAPYLQLRGWIYGEHGKLQKFWRDPGTGRPAFFVPQSALSPMTTCPRLRTPRIPKRA